MKHLYLIVIILLVACNDSKQERYALYHNDKYNFSVEYPLDLLEPLPEADMGDGKKFVSKDGKAELVVAYEYIDPEKIETDKDELKAVYNYFKRKYDKKLEFEYFGNGYFLLIGRIGLTVYSEKYIIKDGLVCSCTFIYPFEKYEFYVEPSKRIFATFR